MKRYLIVSLSVLAALCFAATVIDATGIADGTLFDTIVGFLSFGGVGLIAGTPATATPGPGYEEGAPIEAGGGAGDTGREYLENDIDKTLIKVRPSDTPLDTLTRNIGNIKECPSWEAGDWEVGVPPIMDELDEAYTKVGSGSTYGDFKVKNRKMWSIGDAFYLMNVDGSYVTDGGTPALPLAFTVRDNGASANYINVHRISSDGTSVIPSIGVDTTKYLVRIDTAVSEDTAQVASANMNPARRVYYNQIHMAMVEETVIHALYKKKVNMDFSTYKEQTIWNMKRGMEMANIWGPGGLSYDKDGKLVHLATGLFLQATQTATYDGDQMINDDMWRTISRNIFDGNNGAETRFLFAGSGLLNRLGGASSYVRQIDASKTEIVQGVKVNRIETAFGTLLVRPMGVLFPGARADYGLVLDLNYVKKYVMEPLTAKVMNFDATGQRRVNAVRLLETYSLYLENLPAHCRIMPE